MPSEINPRLRDLPPTGPVGHMSSSAREAHALGERIRGMQADEEARASGVAPAERSDDGTYQPPAEGVDLLSCFRQGDDLYGVRWPMRGGSLDVARIRQGDVEILPITGALRQQVENTHGGLSRDVSVDTTGRVSACNGTSMRSSEYARRMKLEAKVAAAHHKHRPTVAAPAHAAPAPWSIR